MSASSAGEVTITKTELSATIKVGKGKNSASGSVPFDSQSDGLPWLKVFSDSFEGMYVRAIQFRYVNACASTQSGLFTMGWDPDSKDVATTRAKIASYQPNCGGPVWGSCQFTVPIRQSNKQYYATATEQTLKGPGVLAWAVDASSGDTDLVCGEIWVTYTVTLFGPKA